MAEDNWIIDQETLEQAKTHALETLQLMQAYGGVADTEESQAALREISSKQHLRISLIEGVMSAMGALQADGYPDDIDTSALAPMQEKLEAAHEAEGERLRQMAEQIGESAESASAASHEFIGHGMTAEDVPQTDEQDARDRADEDMNRSDVGWSEPKEETDANRDA